MRRCLIHWSFGRWSLVALMTICCFAPARVMAQSLLAGTKAGEERGQFCWCPPGKFKMGDAEVEVTLTHGFWMGKYEVTQAQYQYVMRYNPSNFDGVFLPVETMG